MPSDSLPRRYAFKLSGNLVGLGSRFFIQAVAARALGPASYGDFSFLTEFFTRLTGLFGLGTPLALNTKISQRPQESGLVAFYNYFIFLVCLATGVAMLSVYAARLGEYIWPGQQWIFVVAAAAWGLGTWYVQVLNGLLDAYGLTVKSEIARFWQAPCSAFLIAFLMVGGMLTLGTFFLYQYVLLLSLALVWHWILRRSGYSSWTWTLPWEKVQGYLREFYEYSQPLVTYSVVGFVTAVGERWLLQVSEGSVEQGYFGLSYRIAAICFLFTGAMTPLISREFSIAAQARDTERMRSLFSRYIPLFYVVACFLSAFLAFQADRIAFVFGGSAFSGAVMPLAVMAFYPVHQTYGQLSGSLFFATGQTGLYRNIGIATMVAGLPIAYFLIAPRSASGLEIGATGLALKMVLLQIVAVNLQLFFNTRLLGLSLARFSFYQIVPIISFSAAAYVVRVTLPWPHDGGWGDTFSFFTAAALYSGSAVILLISLPSWFGLNRGDRTRLVALFTKALKKYVTTLP